MTWDHWFASVWIFSPRLRQRRAGALRAQGAADRASPLRGEGFGRRLDEFAPGAARSPICRDHPAGKLEFRFQPITGLRRPLEWTRLTGAILVCTAYKYSRLD